MTKTEKQQMNLKRFQMRFFDIKTQYMAQVRYYDLISGYAVVSYSYADEYTPDEEVELSDGILMQCINLKDKNEKLIYEGDIIKWWNIIFKIEYQQDVCGFRAISKDNLILDHSMSKACIIIGNIHENPELLNNNF